MWTTALSSLLVGSTAPWCKRNNEGPRSEGLRSKIEGISVPPKGASPQCHTPPEKYGLTKGMFKGWWWFRIPLIRSYLLERWHLRVAFKIAPWWSRTTFHPWCALDDWFRVWETADAAFGKVECGKPNGRSNFWGEEIKLSQVFLRILLGSFKH